jgi:ribosomal protein S18 acetylase RimI-like enzyme
MIDEPVKTEIRGDLEFRYGVVPSDRERVREIVGSTGFFNPAEIDIAVELVDERLAKGAPSGYYFVFAGPPGQVHGYVCYGPIAGTAESYDLYWIAVHDSHRGRKLGRVLMDEAEQLIAQAGGHRVYVETSNREHYIPTRAFYDRCGYQVEAVIKDFYAPGDDKVILVKVV